METPYVQDIVWIIKDEAHKNGLGQINWEKIVIRLIKEGYIHEGTTKRNT